MVGFIQALRADGVRVSLAESRDAFSATQLLGMLDREAFRAALRAALVKQRSDQPTFDRLFPLFFQAGAPPMLNAAAELSAADLDLLRRALEALPAELRSLLHMLLEGGDRREGETPEPGERGRPPRESPGPNGRAPGDLSREALSELLGLVEALLAELARLGMPPYSLARLARLLRINLEAMQQQAALAAGQTRLRRTTRRRRHERPDELLDRPFRGLSQSEQFRLRQEVARLAARLRTRAALRLRRGEGPRLDSKATLRAILRCGGVPFELITRRRRRKAKFTLICDVSTSMRPMVEFLLLLLYHIQDQVSRTRSFAFIDHLEEISDPFQQHRPELAVPIVLRRLPPGYYNTDLGSCLAQFSLRHLEAVDRRTTLIVCGDGRNNYNPARADLLEALARRAGRSAWFNPEPPDLWGTDDSDMLAYLPLVDAAFQVSNLRQLSQAVDRLLP
jgi:uncharacterized protein with von Willebrand factor type A (vWA) domain